MEQELHAMTENTVTAMRLVMELETASVLEIHALTVLCAPINATKWMITATILLELHVTMVYSVPSQVHAMELVNA